ncbi:MAG: glycosyltransferase family 4 protein [Nitrospirae bacterium]|nr:glycosyltransferase family 4 protein [Nitrospirota bacterium]
MKILVISFYYSPDLCAGSFRTTAFVKALQDNLTRQDSIDVITTFPNRYKSFRTETKSFEVDGNITIRRIKIPSHSSGFYDQVGSFASYFINALREVRGREYDVVFATSSRLFSGFLGAVISRWKGAPLYLDMRDIFTDTLQSVLGNSRIKSAIPLFRLFEKFTMKSAGRINLVSKGFAPYFQERYRKEYSFFTNGIDDEFLLPYCDMPCSSSNGKVVLTYTGNIGEGQGLEKIVPRIAERYKNIEIRIIGDGGRIGVLKEGTAHLPNVKLLAPINRQELMAYYRESDILFLQLNNYEAFKKVLPSKIFEYAAMYKPIIAGVDGYAKEFLEEHLPDSLIFRPCDIDDFSAKYERYSGIVDLESRKKFIDKFTRKNIMKEMSADLLGFARKGSGTGHC